MFFHFLSFYFIFFLFLSFSFFFFHVLFLFFFFFFHVLFLFLSFFLFFFFFFFSCCRGLKFWIFFGPQFRYDFYSHFSSKIQFFSPSQGGRYLPFEASFPFLSFSSSSFFPPPFSFSFSWILFFFSFLFS